MLKIIKHTIVNAGISVLAGMLAGFTGTNAMATPDGACTQSGTVLNCTMKGQPVQILLNRVAQPAALPNLGSSFPMQPAPIHQPSASVLKTVPYDPHVASFIWATGVNPVSNVYSLRYSPLYRWYDYTTTAGNQVGLLEWLYANHPDWIEYKSDRTTVVYAFGNTTNPSIHIGDPNAVASYVTRLLTASSGFNGVALDNIVVPNKYGEAGHYANTVAPCATAAQPACGGTWVTDYTPDTSQYDTAWQTDNLTFLNIIRQAAHAAGYLVAGNLYYDGGTNKGSDWNDAASMLDIVAVENVPLAGSDTVISTTGNNRQFGFVVDNAYQHILRNANAALSLGKYYWHTGYLNGHDTDLGDSTGVVNPATGAPVYTITSAERDYSMALDLLVLPTLATAANTQLTYFAGAASSNQMAYYPPQMGGYVPNLPLTGNVSNGSATVTNLAKASSVAPGLTVSGPGIPAGTTVTSVQSLSFTMSNPATATTSSAALTLTGFPAFPMGSPVQAPPAADPYAKTGDCGWVNGQNNGVCSRQYQYGWVYVNTYCQASQTGCQAPATSVTLPAPPTPGSNWYDTSCNLVSYGPTNPYSLLAARALIVAQGTTCPWGRP